jgi:DNA-binding NarL/FixJ family response regulator
VIHPTPVGIRSWGRRVVIADDSLLVRNGIVWLLRDAGIEVAAEAASAEELLLAVDERGSYVAIVGV